MQRLESAGVIVGCNEVDDVRFKLRMGVVVIPFDRRLLDRPVHALDLAVRPRMVHLSQAVVDLILAADAVKDVLER